MLKRNIILLLLMFVSLKSIAMEQDPMQIASSYGDLPSEIIEQIIKQYLKTSIDSLDIPMGNNSLIRFEATFNSFIKNSRLVNHLANDVLVGLKFYAYSLLVQKFNKLPQEQKIDCLSFFLQKNNASLAIAVLLSFLDISQMNEQSLMSYLKPRYKLLNHSFLNKKILASKKPKFLINIQSLTKEKLKLFLEIQSNISQQLLFNVNEWVVISVKRHYKGFLKTILTKYDGALNFIKDPLSIEAARGSIPALTGKAINKEIGLTTIHWAIMGNPSNIIEVLEFLLLDTDIQNLSLENLQLTIRLATHWSDSKVMEYLLSRFQRNLPYDYFMRLMNKNYKSTSLYTFLGDTLDVPLNHAIKYQNNKDYEKIIIILINYGASLNCIGSLNTTPKTKSAFVNKLLANIKYLPQIVKELMIIKETNFDQPYTLQTIINACNQASKPKVPKIRQNTSPTPKPIPLPSSKETLRAQILREDDDPIDQPVNITNSTSNRLRMASLGTTKVQFPSRSHNRINHTLSAAISQNQTITKSNYMQIGVNMGVAAIGLWLCYKMLKNNNQKNSQNVNIHDLFKLDN